MLINELTSNAHAVSQLKRIWLRNHLSACASITVSALSIAFAVAIQQNCYQLTSTKLGSRINQGGNNIACLQHNAIRQHETL